MFCALPRLGNSRGQYRQNPALLELTFYRGRQTLKKIKWEAGQEVAQNRVEIREKAA